MRWSFSVLVIYPVGDFTANGAELLCAARHCSGVLEAETEAEAKGFARDIGLRAYPLRDGWRGHHVLVSDADDVVYDLEVVKPLEKPH